ncbi:MAG: amino acid/amide ABC transporter substrate-binding protein, HAAT family [Candidatus Electronema aureum]|uniref:Amino acid/amide ABC transporter substrate-binding protein, HAAT family n=1 Tax=Candidatus Electronema aureum TaxID=2005002 RepID=A0A521G3W1_9BACT|nr:MAG: amino acid/amide ABC transporter substrate-binding protein, HAAT family [Candidatus Electronema aureum]
MRLKLWILFSTCCLLLPDHGVAAVKVGQSSALTGPTAFLGAEIQKGAKAYFDKRAAEDIVLTSKDDGYEPDRCLANTEEFIKDGAQVLFGYLGTPTSKVAVPLANESKTLFFGASTGAEFLSDPVANPSSFALRASYGAEIENMMRHLKEDLGIKRVSIFVQRDDFGLTGIKGAVAAEKKLGGIKIVPEVPAIPADNAATEDWTTFWNSVPHYKRNTVSVGGGVRQIRGNAAEAVILVGTARSCALAINQWHKMGFKVPMLNISFVGSRGLAERLNESDNVYISQVVPDPWDASLPIVKQYQEDMGAEKYEFISLEAYIAANVLHQAVKNVKGEVTSEAIKTSLESLSHYDAGGVPVSFGPDDRRGMDAVYLTKIEKTGDEATFVYVDKLVKPVK